MRQGPGPTLLKEAAMLAGQPTTSPLWTPAVALVLGIGLVTGCPKGGSASKEDPGIRAARTQFGYIDTQVQVFAAEHRRAPTPDEGLSILFDGVKPVDPWGNPVVYIVPGPDGQAYDLLSYGADGAPGGKKEAADLKWSELK